MMRAYTPTDLPAMQHLLQTFPNPREIYPTAAELPELLNPAASKIPTEAVVWETDSDLLGFAAVSPYNNLHFHFRPDTLTPDREQTMIAWAVACIARRIAPGGEPQTLDASARDDDPAKAAFLQRHGFIEGDQQVLSMTYSLLDPFPDPQLPPGFTLRPLAGPAEVPAYVDAHRAAYGTEYMTVEHRLDIMRATYYRPDLDLVITAPDGTIAAFCVCSIHDDQTQPTGPREGEIGIVGSRPEFRGQGLARAAVLAGMHALKRLGIQTAALTVGNWNHAAVRLYQSLGFQTRWALHWYAKPVTETNHAP
jgi:mycothiol synthase